MATKEAIFDLASVEYSKETQVLDYSFETANGLFKGQITIVRQPEQASQITYCAAEVSVKEMVQVPGTGNTPIMQEQYVKLGTLSMSQARFELNQFPLHEKTPALLGDFQNYVFALTKQGDNVTGTN